MIVYTDKNEGSSQGGSPEQLQENISLFIFKPLRIPGMAAYSYSKGKNIPVTQETQSVWGATSQPLQPEIVRSCAQW